jgi:Prokaryotic Cytochrome C oxidase subunit IV
VKAYLRNPLTLVWALLTAVIVASWAWLTAMATDVRKATEETFATMGGAAQHLNTTITVVVLLAAAVKAQLVIWLFMEVRHAPTWLKATTSGWLVALFGLLLGFYFAAQ